MHRYKRGVRFLLAGGSAAITEYCLFIVFRNAGLMLVVANTLSFLGGLVVSFSINKLWVFTAKGDTPRQFSLYFILAIVNLAISNLLVWLLAEKLDIKALLAKLIVMAVIASWNYIFFSKLIFRERHLDV